MPLGGPGGVRVLFVGDTHGNDVYWAERVVPAARDHGVDQILQVGDFGWWPWAHGFLRLVAASEVPVWFLDGNHEHHDYLAASVRRSRRDHDIGDLLAPVPLDGAISYLPRGCRLDLEGVRVAILGGAHSVDRGARLPGHDWFPAETISSADLDDLAAGGIADLFVTHDAPAGYDIPGLTPERLVPA